MIANFTISYQPQTAPGGKISGVGRFGISVIRNLRNNKNQEREKKEGTGVEQYDESGGKNIREQTVDRVSHRKHRITYGREHGKEAALIILRHAVLKQRGRRGIAAAQSGAGHEQQDAYRAPVRSEIKRKERYTHKKNRQEQGTVNIPESARGTHSRGRERGSRGEKSLEHRQPFNGTGHGVFGKHRDDQQERPYEKIESAENKKKTQQGSARQKEKRPLSDIRRINGTDLSARS